MHWSLDDIPIFVAVVEHSGITAAANQLHLSKSAVSKAIARLESALNVRLLERNSRNVRVTSEGEAFYTQSLTIMEQVNNANAVMVGLVAKPAGKLVVALPIAFSREIFAKHLPKFKRLYPDIDLEIIISSHSVDIIRDQIDVAVVIGELNDSEIIAKPLYQSRLCWVASPNYIESNALGYTAQDLQSHIQICESRYKNARFPVRQHDQKNTLNLIKGIVHINDPLSVREAVLNGGGVSLLPDQYCQKQIRDKELIQVYTDIHFEASAATLSVIYPSRRLLSNKTRVFIDFLEEACRDL